MKHNILLIDDDSMVRTSMSGFLKDEGFEVRAVASGDEGVALVRQNFPFSVALIDFHMPEMTGPEVIRQIREHNQEMALLGFSGDDSVEAHNTSLDSGAAFFLTKDTADAKLLGVLHRVCREVERKKKPLTLVADSERLNLISSVGMIGFSEATAGLAHTIHKMAPSRESVLIRGEHGTGKEKVARALHNLSPWYHKPFVPVNCAAIPHELMESEFFGHEKGAFTGADRTRRGHFEAAQGGTLFLDEVGELPLSLQAKLLRVLQEKTVTPLGSNEVKKVDFRLVAATNAPIETMIEENLFRADLYFRLNVLPIEVKPLRERRQDIPYLAQAFLEAANKKEGKSKVLLDATVTKLESMTWAGNVRELEHCIRRLVALSPEEIITDSDLELFGGNRVKKVDPRSWADIRLFTELEEREMILKALKKMGSVAGAARSLDIRRSTLRDKIKRYGIEFKKN